MLSAPASAYTAAQAMGATGQAPGRPVSHRPRAFSRVQGYRVPPDPSGVRRRGRRQPDHQEHEHSPNSPLPAPDGPGSTAGNALAPRVPRQPGHLTKASQCCTQVCLTKVPAARARRHANETPHQNGSAQPPGQLGSLKAARNVPRHRQGHRGPAKRACKLCGRMGNTRPAAPPAPSLRQVRARQVPRGSTPRWPGSFCAAGLLQLPPNCFARNPHRCPSLHPAPCAVFSVWFSGLYKHQASPACYRTKKARWKISPPGLQKRSCHGR